MLILSRLVDKHGRHRQFLFLIGWFLKNLLCKKKDKSCLNIDICIQNAVISIKISELNYRYMPLKPLNQMNWNLVGSIYGRSSVKIAHFVAIRYQTWPPQAILVSDWPIFIRPSVRRNVLWYTTVRPFYMSCSNLRTPWPIHLKFHRVIGIDGLTVWILFGEISSFHSRVMGLYSSNCRRFSYVAL